MKSEHKRCSQCGEKKQHSEFNRNGTGGLRTACRTCYNFRKKWERAGRLAVLGTPTRATGRHYDHPLYPTWNAMLYRCNSTNSNSYRWYGAKGIRVCERWQDFWNFAEDMGEKPSSVHTLDRIDNAGDYCPENCRWATPKEQANNRTSNRLCQVFDETRSFKEWADLAGMSHQRLRHRVDNLGIGLEAALCGG